MQDYYKRTMIYYKNEKDPFPSHLPPPNIPCFDVWIYHITTVPKIKRGHGKRDITYVDEVMSVGTVIRVVYQ